jgi:type II secretory pathway component PulC
MAFDTEKHCVLLLLGAACAGAPAETAAEAPLEPDATPTTATVVPTRAEYVDPIVARNIFDAAAEAAGPTEANPVADLPLRLLATVAGAPASSSALFQRTDTKERAFGVAVGDEVIDGWALASVNPRQVVLAQADGRRGTLDLEFTPRARRVEPGQVLTIDANHYVADRDIVRAALAESEKEARLMRVSPGRYRDDVGVRLSHLSGRSALSRLKFRRGDILVSANGHSLAERTSEALLRAFDVGSVEVSFVRRRRLVTRTFELE